MGASRIWERDMERRIDQGRKGRDDEICEEPQDMEIAGNGRRPESTEDIRNARCLEKALLRRRIRLLREQVLAREKEQWDAALCRRFFQLFQLLEREKGAQGLGLSGPVQGEGAGGGRLEGAGGLCRPALS